MPLMCNKNVCGHKRRRGPDVVTAYSYCIGLVQTIWTLRRLCTAKRLIFNFIGNGTLRLTGYGERQSRTPDLELI